MLDITARPGSKRLHVTANFLQCVTPGWEDSKNPNFLVLPNYWMNSPGLWKWSVDEFSFSKVAWS